MTTTIIVLLVIAALLLIIVVLIQNPKDGGLSAEFGGSAGSKMFGVQKTGDIVEKLTWGFFAFLVVGSLATLILIKTGMHTETSKNDVNVEQAATGTNIPTLPSAEPAQTLPSSAPVETTPAP